MPLSLPTCRRQALHQRSIECRGFEREDGLWDIEARMVDIKDDFVHTQSRGDLSPGEPLHDMWLRVTLDNGFLIHDIQAVTDAAPFVMCPNITHRFQLLKGLRINAGWNRKVKELLGDVKGCTHLVELLGPIATTAFQTIYPALRKRMEKLGVPFPEEEKPVVLDTCHAFASDSVVVKQYFPKYYTGPKPREQQSAKD